MYKLILKSIEMAICNAILMPVLVEKWVRPMTKYRAVSYLGSFPPFSFSQNEQWLTTCGSPLHFKWYIELLGTCKKCGIIAQYFSSAYPLLYAARAST